jgi:hypothetical protein
MRSDKRRWEFDVGLKFSASFTVSTPSDHHSNRVRLGWRRSPRMKRVFATLRELLVSFLGSLAAAFVHR